MNKLIKKTKKNKKGLSPVVGVLLMVAVTVILAAVIASFIFGMGTKVKSAPQVQLYLEDAPDEVNGDDDKLFIVTHYGGDDLNLEEIRLQVMNDTKVCRLSWTEMKFEGDNLMASSPDLRDGMFSVGESFTVNETSNVFSKRPDILTLRVIHIPTGTIIFEGSVRIE